MVIGLLGLALVMILGGVASVVQGFPYVRLESGLAMVIGGASAASAGAILLGLAATVDRLKRLEQAFRSGRQTAAPFVEAPRDIALPPPSSAPVLAGAAGLAGITFGAAATHAPAALDEASALAIDPADRLTSPHRELESEPTLPDLLPDDDTAKIEPPAPKPPVPDLEPVERSSPANEGADLFAGSEPVSSKVGEPSDLALRPSLEDGVQLQADPAPAEQPAPTDALEVVGTYASGGNTYVMYSNGAIEADTPKGRFSFDSLDELKAFVQAGGESGTRGAA